LWDAYGADICEGALNVYEGFGCVVQKFAVFGLYGGIPPDELPELPLFTLDDTGLRPSEGKVAGGVKTFPIEIGEGCELLIEGAKAGYLCMLDKSGGGS